MKLNCHHSLVLAAALSLAVLPQRAPAQAVLTKLGDFDVDNGQNPQTGMVFGPDGNLYGTTQSGGSTTVTPAYQGCVYTVSPSGGNLHRFAAFSSLATGLGPDAPLILGADGNFYGTTEGGGVVGTDGSTTYDRGSIFQLKLDGTITLLYSFLYDPTTTNYPHGTAPEAPLLEINPGVFLGTTAAGGDDGGNSTAYGTLFEYNLGSNTLTTLKTFTYGSVQGDAPEARIISGGDGSFYSTTLGGGANNLGAIIQVGTSAGAVGAIYSFATATGFQPNGGLTLGPDGKLYGLTPSGGVGDFGTYYRISTAGGFELLGSFNGLDKGAQPHGEMVLASDGNFYGTTNTGGINGDGSTPSAGFGTVFQLTTAGVLTNVYSFTDPTTTGYQPTGTLVQGPDGRLYGNTNAGGSTGRGVVFALSLNPVIISATTAAGTVGQPLSYQITATNNPTSFVAAGVPTGLAISSTGLISGQPTASGTFHVTLSARNGMGTGTAMLTLTVAPEIPEVTLAATIPEVTEESGKSGKFTLTLSKLQTRDIVVKYAIKGGAINGVDYTRLTGTKKIPAGKKREPIRIFPKGDLGGAHKKLVRLELESGTDYAIGTKGKVNVEILAAP